MGYELRRNLETACLVYMDDLRQRVVSELGPTSMDSIAPLTHQSDEQPAVQNTRHRVQDCLSPSLITGKSSNICCQTHHEMPTTWDVTGPEVLIGRHLHHSAVTKTSSIKIAAFDLVGIHDASDFKSTTLTYSGCNFGCDQNWKTYGSRPQ